jgi:hypothetical protein
MVMYRQSYSSGYLRPAIAIPPQKTSTPKEPVARKAWGANARSEVRPFAMPLLSFLEAQVA